MRGSGSPAQLALAHSLGTAAAQRRRRQGSLPVLRGHFTQDRRTLGWSQGVSAELSALLVMWVWKRWDCREVFRRVCGAVFTGHGCVCSEGLTEGQ